MGRPLGRRAVSRRHADRAHQPDLPGRAHQCLVAEISYDPIVIAPNDAPGASAWLAQRNLAFSS